MIFYRMLYASVVLLGSQTGLAQTPIAQNPEPPKLHRVVPPTPTDLRLIFRYTGRRLPLVSAHRGGAGPGLPENCIATFEQTLQRTFSMLEIDPRLTKDGEIVLHHDATLERTTTGSGLLVDKTLAELKALQLKDDAGNITEYQMPTLDEALSWARGKTILVIDHKDVPYETAIDKIRQHRAESFAMLIVGRLEDVVACHAADPDLMMEVMVPDHNRIAQFDKSGVPWENMIAFVGHTPPDDESLYEAIHARSTSCMVGTSRNLDREFDKRFTADAESLEDDYRKLYRLGADIIETDIPRKIGPLLFKDNLVFTARLRSYFLYAR